MIPLAKLNVIQDLAKSVKRISHDKGAGCGVIVQHDGKQLMITVRHVLYGASPEKVTFDGHKVESSYI